MVTLKIFFQIQNQLSKYKSGIFSKGHADFLKFVPPFFIYVYHFGPSKHSSRTCYGRNNSNCHVSYCGCFMMVQGRRPRPHVNPCRIFFYRTVTMHISIATLCIKPEIPFHQVVVLDICFRFSEHKKCSLQCFLHLSP